MISGVIKSIVSTTNSPVDITALDAVSTTATVVMHPDNNTMIGINIYFIVLN
jgi:hypothetical protein|tara:strand:+ start:567 stop:722 length:156 start_codon:yes stop_codon:yes gene_type:complete